MQLCILRDEARNMCKKTETTFIFLLFNVFRYYELNANMSLKLGAYWCKATWNAPPTSLQQVKIWSYARADLVLRWALKVNVILHIITSLSAFADIFQRADGVQPESWARSIAAKTFLFLCFRSRLPQDTFVSLFRCKQRPLSNRLSQTEVPVFPAAVYDPHSVQFII